MQNSFQNDASDRPGTGGAKDVAGEIDLERMKDAAGYDDECLKELIDVYFEQTEGQFAQLGRALSDNSPEAVRSIAHSAVGASATCGLNNLVAPLRALEKMAIEGDLEGGKDEFERASREFGRVKAFFKDFIESSTA